MLYIESARRALALIIRYTGACVSASCQRRNGRVQSAESLSWTGPERHEFPNWAYANVAEGTGVKGTPLTPVPKPMSSKHASIGPVWVFLSPGDLPASRGSHCLIRQDAHARQGLASGAQTI